MRLLSAGGQDDTMSELVDDLLTQWLAAHDSKGQDGKRKKAKKV
jgi:hypothetical protein